MKFTPLHDWAVIKPSSSEDISAGGLYIPDSAKEKPARGTVEAIGPGAYEEERYGKKKKEQTERKYIPTTVKPGEYVLFEQYAGQTYKIGTEDRVLVRERNILGMLPDGESRPARPLQIPASTSHGAVTAMSTRTGRTELMPEKRVKGSAKAKAKKTPSKTKAGPKKTVKKKTVKKRAEKTAKKAAKKAAKSPARGTKTKPAGKKR